MATHEADDVLGDIADSLGIDIKTLTSMDAKKIRKLAESGDLDPATKARLIRAHPIKAQESMSIASELQGMDEADYAEAPGGGGREDEVQYA
ncbi:MAG: hypothetical protein AAFV69_08675 [Pseudomonadota bacterium]